MAHKYDRIQWEKGMLESPDKHNGTVYVHRENAAQKLGRKLKPKEVVHHKDENKLNNDMSNLLVFRTAADHDSYHSQINAGLIPKLTINKDGSYSTARRVWLCKCGSEMGSRAKMCSECWSSLSSRPSKEDLEKLIWQYPMTKIGQMFSVSDNAVRRWVKKYNLETPPMGYFLKKGK